MRARPASSASDRWCMLGLVPSGPSPASAASSQRALPAAPVARTADVGFQIGGYELGLDPDVNGVTTGNNAVAYWGVPDIESAHARMLLAGAKVVKPIANVGGDIKVAMVADPFGNIIGLIENPHFRPEGDIQPAVGA